MSEELRILRNFLREMTKAYRARNDNASVVHDILLAGTSTSGRTSCIAKCRELGMDPYGHTLDQVRERTKMIEPVNNSYKLNEPLTLEELIDAQRTPIWWDYIETARTPFDATAGWIIVDLNKLPEPWYAYGKTWLDYRHKPEREDV